MRHCSNKIGFLSGGITTKDAKNAKKSTELRSRRLYPMVIHDIFVFFVSFVVIPFREFQLLPEFQLLDRIEEDEGDVCPGSGNLRMDPAR